MHPGTEYQSDAIHAWVLIHYSLDTAEVSTLGTTWSSHCLSLGVRIFSQKKLIQEMCYSASVDSFVVFLFLCQSSSIHPTAEGSKLQFSATMFLHRWGTSIHPLLLIYCFLPIKMTTYSILVENYIPLSFFFFFLILHPITLFTIKAFSHASP